MFQSLNLSLIHISSIKKIAACGIAAAALIPAGVLTAQAAEGLSNACLLYTSPENHLPRGLTKNAGRSEKTRELSGFPS